MGFLNWLGKIGKKVWKHGKNMVGKVRNTLGNVQNNMGWFDDVLHKSSQNPVAGGWLDSLRDNGIYKRIHGVVNSTKQIADRFHEKHLPTAEALAPRGGRELKSMVERGLGFMQDPELLNTFNMARDLRRRATTAPEQFVPTAPPAPLGF